MVWLFGILFIATLAAWLLRERQFRRQSARLEQIAEEMAQGREVLSLLARGDSARADERLKRVAQELQHLRRQRRLAEANLEIILSSMQEAVLVLDSHRSVRLVNPAARKLFTMPANVFGLPVLEALREPTVDDMVAAALKTGQPQESELEISGRKPPLILAVNISPMRDAAGEAGALAMFRDVTRLTQLEQVRREFVANVSHELRTPLAIFQGYVENLVDCPEMEREERLAIFHILERHSKRLNALVEDLLILARLEGGSGELAPEPMDVQEFCAETARDWALRMEKKKVTLRQEVPPALPHLTADRLRLGQVISNLLENALKYTPVDGTIVLGAAHTVGSIEMWVRDHGQGIVSIDLPHIFERFYRADKARSRELGGTGLGLSIVKHIVQAHGGTVTAESIYGKSTTIRIRIPLNETTTPDDTPENGSENRPAR